MLCILCYPIANLPQRPEFEEPLTPIDPTFKFKDVRSFAEVHIAGTAREVELESRGYARYNKEKFPHRAWHLATSPLTDDQETHIMAIDLAEHARPYLPPVGHRIGLQLFNKATQKPLSVMWEGEHIPFAGLIKTTGIRVASHDLIFVKLTLAAPEVEGGGVIAAPLLPQGADLAGLSSVELTEDNAIAVCLHFRASESTSQMELLAMHKFLRGEGISSRQVSALRYLVTFDEPETVVNLFDKFPLMADPHAHRGRIRPSILKRYECLNEHQMKAYRELLPNLPCGIGMLPGGPGSGKTHFAMTTIGLMQSDTQGKVLYLLDINKPLEDTVRKYLAMWEAAGTKKTAIRVKAFGTELKNSSKFEEVREATKAAAGITDDDNVDSVIDFSRQFMKYFQNPAIRPAEGDLEQDCPTLDEAAWLHYEANPDEYRRLTAAMKTSTGDPMEVCELRFLIFWLYRTVLRRADFIATTPCVAAGKFSTLFQPDLVVLDEAAHARELTSLIPIAFFPDCVWLFIGDFRQTLPFVKYCEQNNRSPQLLVSTMERAHKAGAIGHQLLINHRAFGNLQRLASKMIYDGEMVSGIPERDRFPETLEAVRGYFGKLMGGRACEVPRLVVQIDTHVRPTRVNTSWLHMAHTRWTMGRVIELLANPKFVNAADPTKPGTILLLSPYKAAVLKYKEAIATCERLYPNCGWSSRVEARTWDVSQGHEADVVGIDYVRNQATTFMDGQHRFNVGLTRARQGEWHIMAPRMTGGESFKSTKYLKGLYEACVSNEEGHVISLAYN